MNSGYSFINSAGKVFYLNEKDIILRSKKKQKIYFFSSDQRPMTACELPFGYTVAEAGVTRMPVLRKIR